MITLKDRIKIAIWDFRHRVDVFFNPRQKSLRNAITPEWKDLDGRIEDFLSAVIISFVEEENGLDQIQMLQKGLSLTDNELKDEWGGVDIFWDYYEAHYPVFKRIKEIYNWIKFDRKNMVKYIELCYDQHNVDYDEVLKAETRLYEKDTEMFNDLVKYRGYLWT